MVNQTSPLLLEPLFPLYISWFIHLFWWRIFSRKGCIGTKSSESLYDPQCLYFALAGFQFHFPQNYQSIFHLLLSIHVIVFVVILLRFLWYCSLYMITFRLYWIKFLSRRWSPSIPVLFVLENFKVTGHYHALLFSPHVHLLALVLHSLTCQEVDGIPKVCSKRIFVDFHNLKHSRILFSCFIK